MKFKSTKASARQSSKKPVTHSPQGRRTPQHGSSKGRPGKRPLGYALSIERLVGLTSELQVVREYPPVTKRKDGKYEGDILGFVRGLRLSARVLYFLREHLSETGLEVSWGHLLNEKQESCSPECDIIVHEQGVVHRWNGFEDPVMNFSFIKAERVRLVVSCKSILTSIDTEYPRALKKYGVKNLFLFAESCEGSQVKRLRERAIKAGYQGLWFLYTTNNKEVSFLGTNESTLIDFGEKMLATVIKRKQKPLRKKRRV